MASCIPRLGAFNLVGLGGFLVQITTIAVLTRRFGWPAAAATAVGLEVAILHNFIGHSRWTWADRAVERGAGPRRWWRYQFAKALSLGLNLAITQALASAGIAVELANAMAVALCALPNFLVADRLIFVATEKGGEPPVAPPPQAASASAKQNG